MNYNEAVSLSLFLCISPTNSMERSPSWEANSHSASQDIPRFYGTRKFITMFTRSCHGCLTWAWWIQSTPSHHISLRSILILSSILHQGFPSSVCVCIIYEGVSKSFRTGHLDWELQTVQLSATRCSCIAILWVSMVSFAAIILCVASQRAFIVDSLRKLLDTPSYVCVCVCVCV
jgi:hypothetical protein